MPAHIIPSKREAYADFLRNLAEDGQPQTAEVLATLLFDADRVARLVEQVATLTERVDSLETECANLRTLAEGAYEARDFMAGVPADGFRFEMEDERDREARLSAEQILTERRNRDSLSIAS